MSAGAKKVCIVTTSHGIRDDRIYHKEALSLARHGYQVYLIAQQRGETVDDSIRVIALPPARTRFDRFAKHCLRAFRLALRVRADVYHLHDPELVAVGVVLKIMGKRVIFDAHEDYRQKLLSKNLPGPIRRAVASAWWLWESFAGRFFDHVIAADSYVQRKFPKDRCTVLANFPPSNFAAGLPPRREDGVFRIMYVGGIDVARGVTEVIQALDILRLEAVEFHVAGDSDAPEVTRILSRHPRVVYHGQIPWEDVKRLLATGDVGTVLLQPVPAYSYCPGENIVKLFEYMAVGLPVLISNFPKLKELIESSGSGMAVDPTSPQQIAKAIDYLYRNPAVRRRMSENGRKAVQQHYNWEHEEKKLLAVYERVLGNDRRSGAERVAQAAPRHRQ